MSWQGFRAAANPFGGFFHTVCGSKIYKREGSKLLLMLGCLSFSFFFFSFFLGFGFNVECEKGKKDKKVESLICTRDTWLNICILIEMFLYNTPLSSYEAKSNIHLSSTLINVSNPVI